ncbi:hypothetical protein GCM10023177_58310 [Streptomyces violaceoruber]|nr:hypothetical protein JCM4020_41150 [Streptomyces coelicolor]
MTVTGFADRSDSHWDTRRAAVIVRIVAVTSQGIPHPVERRALRVKAARLRRSARAGGRGPPPLPVSATAAPAPGHSARNTAKAGSQATKQLAQPEHQDHDQVQAEPE